MQTDLSAYKFTDQCVKSELSD